MKTARAATILCRALMVAAPFFAAACATHRTDSSERAGDVVAERYYPERIHFREPSDTVNVYYYDSRRPDVVISRRVYREADGRTYYIEREPSADRRYYFDDDAARSRTPGTNRGWRDNGRPSAEGNGTQ